MSEAKSELEIELGTGTGLELDLEFKLERLTLGALLYQEVNPKTGEKFSAPNARGCNIGPLYLRKAIFPPNTHEFPKTIHVVVRVTD